MLSIYYSDSGRTIRFGNEELSRLRRARKVFIISEPIKQSATLYIYACSHMNNLHSLWIRVNRHTIEVKPDSIAYLHWLNIPLPGEYLVEGQNMVELWSDNSALDGWMLGLDPTCQSSSSQVSVDGGKSWQNTGKGIHSLACGEYILRMRSSFAVEENSKNSFVEERSEHLLGETLRQTIPLQIKSISNPWDKMLALSSWVSMQWQYRNSIDGIEYAPWDPLTILSWGKRCIGQVKSEPVVMCVHYGAVFTMMAQVLDIPARCVCSTDDINVGKGHFVSEVWMQQWNKWCQVDPNCDIVYVENGTPLSVGELFSKKDKLRQIAVKGKGFVHQPKSIQSYAEDNFLTGRSFRYWAVWPRNDFLSNPHLMPTSHGCGAYAESDWLWAKTEMIDHLGMFPNHIESQLLCSLPSNIKQKNKRN